jgi:probable HAF family extracellular repeat protein
VCLAVALFVTVPGLFAQRAGQTYSIVDLGTLGGATSEAVDINNLGEVVGSAATADLSSSRAVLWRDGRAIDLSQRLASGGWTLVAAHSINDVGQIVGVGLRAGQRRAFVLTPQ